ncbi:MAG: asparagine synthase (glutamine-hydrolyzing) [Terrimicrobiaceae bacterium]|nr:asparagine synthase (glutamine-hydrolyzing) [Terrimicrobiaceae bacterium]
MCGIAGFLGTGDRGDLEAMTARLTHRGPDAEGFFIDPGHGLHLGHRRLSIVDLGGGGQPMSSADGRLAVVFNGEIYNHAELRAQLSAKGHEFLTDHSDTEVLLHGWREWGEGLVGRLNGMWAFAIWDLDRRCLFLSRDRFGKKPLYYFQRAGTFGFSSELTSLLKHPAAPRNLSELARVKFFAHALIPAPCSAIEGIWKLPAAHNLVVEENGPACRVSRYWRYVIEPVEPSATDGELAEELRGLLLRATRRRLMADVPLGIFLSGGIDSSLIAALAAGEIGGPALSTFTIGFTEPSFDESVPAKRMAGHLKTSHHEQILDLDAALGHLPRIFDLLDEPQGDGSLLPTWLLARFARNKVTVALGGDGGDELFAGYDPFRALQLAGLYSRVVPRPVHEGLKMLAGFLPVSHANISLDFKIKRTLRGLSHDARLWNPVWLGALEPSELQCLTDSHFDIGDIYSEAIHAWETCHNDDPVDRTLQFYTEIYLQDGILQKADRASMMNSLEVRSPFLDIEVADFARKLPHRYKLRGNTTKYLLKLAAKPLLPEVIVRRKKKGFGSPVGKWLRTGRIAPQPTDGMVREKLARHLGGQADERLFLWCEYVWQEWQKRQQSL